MAFVKRDDEYCECEGTCPVCRKKRRTITKVPDWLKGEVSEYSTEYKGVEFK